MSTTLRLNVENLSPLPRTGWATVALPKKKAGGLPNECTFLSNDGRAFRAVRGRTAGIKTVYRVRVTLGGGERISGKLLAAPHPTAMSDVRMHPWVADDILEMVPVLGVGVGDGISWPPTWASHLSAVVVDRSPAHQRWRIEQLAPGGMHATWWVELQHGDPTAQLWGRIVWSDRSDPAQQRTISGLFVKCGELIALDFAKRNGCGTPVAVGREWFTQLNDELITFGDGMGLALSGRILAFISGDMPKPGSQPDDVETEMGRDFDQLVAATGGPLLGVCLDWDGEWLAAKSLPRFANSATALQAAAAEAATFAAQLEQRAGWFAPRPYGTTRTPGQTGDQPDFGSTKGSNAVVAGDPRAIYAMQYSAYADCLRGYTHFESDGTPVLAANHPQWVTWSRVTHWSQNVSIDRLGKDPSLPAPTGGWQGLDDEHCSMNAFAAYLALSDDPLCEDQLRFLLETDRACYRMRFPDRGSGPTRAQGRTAGTWAQLACVADGEVAAGFVNLLNRRFAQSATITTLHGDYPMHTPCVAGPDPRKPIYDLSGQLARYTCVWELGLFLVGHQQAIRCGAYGVDLEAANRLALIVAETLARFGFFRQGDTWYTVGDIYWNNGQAPPGGMAYPSPQINAAPGRGDVMSWTFAGLLIAHDILPRTHPAWPQLDQYVRDMRPTEALNRTEAEWWAISSALPGAQ